MGGGLRVDRGSLGGWGWFESRRREFGGGGGGSHGRRELVIGRLALLTFLCGTETSLLDR